MRKPATILVLVVLVALVAFPALSWAQGAETLNFSSGDVSASVQGYGDQTANYQTGFLQVETYEKVTVEKVEMVVTGQYTQLGNQNGIPCSPSGLDLSQGKFEGNITVTNTSASEYTTVTKGNYLAGSANMSSTGGLSLSSTAGISAEGSLRQDQAVNQNASGSLGPGMTGSASYTGTQGFTGTITSQ